MGLFHNCRSLNRLRACGCRVPYSLSLSFCSNSSRLYPLLLQSNKFNVLRQFHSYPISIRNRRTSSTAAISDVSANPSVLERIMKRYEDVIGLTAVKEAQEKVIQSEDEFSRWQDERREKQQQIKSVQIRLKEIHGELDKTSRGEDRYLNLLTQEHAVIKEERKLLDDFRELEKMERNKFSELSRRLRESHERERERGERTKYWSIIGSVLGALIGIIGTTVSNRLRMRELRSLVTEGTGDSSRTINLLTELSGLVDSQQSQLNSFITELKGMMNKNPQIAVSSAASQPASEYISDQQGLEEIAAQYEKVLKALKEKDKNIERELEELKRMVAAEHGYSLHGDGTIVYVGPEMSGLLDQTERNLEWKMKIQTLVNVVMIYTALAIAIPVLAGIFRPPT